MNRLTALLVLVVLALLATASAAGAAAVGKATGQSRAAVVHYWTDARMNDAIPVERAGKPQAGKPGGPNATTYPYTALTQQTPYTSSPTNTNGKVYFTEGNANYVCSGTALVNSVVWTAGHCVNAGPGAFHTNWMFVPAYLNGAAPYGKFTAKNLYSTPGWAGAGDFRYDLGAAAVNTSDTTRETLTKTLGGGRQLLTDGRPLANYTLYGYPAAKPFNGQTLRGCDSPFGLFDPYSAEPKPIGVGCNMTGGSSGGAWLNSSGEVVSVNSFGYSSYRNVMFGPQQGSAAADLYAAAQAG
jgi:hypothetical protein